MYSDDVYRSRLEVTIASLRYWLPSIGDAATVGEDETADYWKVWVKPHTATACPFELMLRADQHYDIVIGNEAFEDCPIESLDMFQPLAAGIAEGNVMHRHWVSAATHLPVAVETTVLRPKMGKNGELDTQPYWHRRRYAGINMNGSEPDLALNCLSKVSAFAPYQFKPTLKRRR